MTQNEIIEKYEDVVLDFYYYYKYVFYYRGTAEDGTTIYADFGGDSDIIYRAEFVPKGTLSSLINESYLLDVRIKEDN